jgi:hypothetical protein
MWTQAIHSLKDIIAVAETVNIMAMISLGKAFMNATVSMHYRSNI